MISSSGYTNTCTSGTGIKVSEKYTCSPSSYTKTASTVEYTTSSSSHTNTSTCTSSDDIYTRSTNYGWKRYVCPNDEGKYTVSSSHSCNTENQSCTATYTSGSSVIMDFTHSCPTSYTFKQNGSTTVSINYTMNQGVEPRDWGQGTVTVCHVSFIMPAYNLTVD